MPDMGGTDRSHERATDILVDMPDHLCAQLVEVGQLEGDVSARGERLVRLQSAAALGELIEQRHKESNVGDPAANFPHTSSRDSGQAGVTTPRRN